MNLKEFFKIFDKFNKYKNKRILVVDDEEFCISSMQAILFSQGIDIEYQCDFCITGKEAIDQVKMAYERNL